MMTWLLSPAWRALVLPVGFAVFALWATEARGQEVPMPAPVPAPPEETREDQADDLPAPPGYAADPGEAGGPTDRGESAPRPDAASGIAVPEHSQASGLWLPRSIFFVPRWALYAALAPVRGGFWVYERYQIKDRAKQVFFNDAGTFGIYPLALFETGFGLNAGLRVVHHDLFGEKEEFQGRASFGGRYRQIYSARLTTGKRLSPLVLVLEGEFDLRDKEQFYGIGNGDAVEASAAMEPIFALTDETAVRTRFRQSFGRGMLKAHLPLSKEVYAKAAGTYLRREFDPPVESDLDVPSIADYYDLSSIIGFREGTSSLVAELELTYDTSRPASIYTSQATRATGWIVSGYAGYTWGLGDDPASYGRYGLDLQRFINLYHGNRILALRVFVESVTGDIDEVPFVDLPRLGGERHLRGYSSGRYRDRAFTLAAAEYIYGLNQSFDGLFFADTGRVWRSLADVEPEGFRLGYGGGIQFHDRQSFLLRAFLASSLDGGLFFSLAFEEIYDGRQRIRK